MKESIKKKHYETNKMLTFQTGEKIKYATYPTYFYSIHLFKDIYYMVFGNSFTLKKNLHVKKTWHI